MRVPKRRSEQERLARRRTDHLLTPEAVARMHRTLDRLKAEHRAAAEEAYRCAEMGDRSDNAAYAAAKAQLNRILSRIASLEDRLQLAIVIERGVGIGGTVRIGSRVTLSVDGVERTYDILGELEANPNRGCISYHSPLGSALLGRRAGDAVRIAVRESEKVYQIIAVR